MADLDTSRQIGASHNRLERRHLTVFECDLVGSTTLADTLDPEELKELLLAYQDSALRWIEKYEGYFVQFAGDAIWAYFGYPNAHEDDACRAIRTGLGIISDVQKIHLYGQTLNVRIGIASGLCVVGNLRDVSHSINMTPSIYDYTTAIGNPPNLAARLQSLVEPGNIAISDDTRNLVGNLFDLQDLGLHQIKGFQEQLNVWRVIEESGEQSRFRAFRSTNKPRIIGRDKEAQVLADLWESVRSSNGQVVFITGEPGIGKSRLIESVIDQFNYDKNLIWWFHCNEFMRGTPFAPIIETLRNFAEISDKIDKSKATLKRRFNYLDQDDIDVLYNLIGIPLVDNYSPITLSPTKQRERLYTLLIKIIKLESDNNPLILVVEDHHWVDPSTLEFLQNIALLNEDLRILIIISSRLIEKESLSFTGDYHVIQLTQLSRLDSIQLIKSLWGNDKSLGSVLDLIIEKTDGVPLFIEDVVYSSRKSELTGNIEDIFQEVPNKLSEHLTYRIDELGKSKIYAQIGSVIGRKFTLQQIVALSGLHESKVLGGLEVLVSSGLLTRSSRDSNNLFVFKHAMIRDAAYSSLLLAERKYLHGILANWLITNDKETVISKLEVIAFQLEVSEKYDLAIEYWLKAGLLSNSRSSYREGVSQLRHAYQLIHQVPATSLRVNTELDVVMTLSAAQAGSGGISGKDAGNLYDEALELCKQLNYPARTFVVLSAASSFHFLRAEFNKAREYALLSLKLAEDSSDPLGFVCGNRILGSIYFIHGQFELAVTFLLNAIEIYEEDPGFHHTHSHSYVLDHKTSALCYLSLSQLALGLLDEALSNSSRAVQHAENINKHSLNCALCYRAAILWLIDSPDEVTEKAANISLRLAQDEKFVTWSGISRLIRGAALLRIGKIRKAYVEIDLGLNEHENVLATNFKPFAQSIKVDKLVTQNNIKLAHQTLIEAEDLSINTKQLWFLPLIVMKKSEVLMKMGKISDAINNYHQALSLAKNNNADFWIYRIIMSINSYGHVDTDLESLSRKYVSELKSRLGDKNDNRFDKLSSQVFQKLGRFDG